MSDEPKDDSPVEPDAETVVPEADAMVPGPVSGEQPAADEPAIADDQPVADESSPAPETTGDAPTREALDAQDGITEPPPVEDLNEPDVEIVPPSGSELRAVVEALVFASPEPITTRQLGQLLEGVPKTDLARALAEVRDEYEREGRGLQLVEVAGGWQITTRPQFNEWLRQLLDPKSAPKLSIKALETLSVIAYKQFQDGKLVGITLPEIIELRGVRSGGVVKTLLERRLVRIVGRKEVVGRPMLYGTTKEFLLQFGLKDLTELPKIEEFAEVLGEEVDVVGLKRALDAPRPVDVPLSEPDAVPDGAGEADAPPDTPAPGEPPAGTE